MSDVLDFRKLRERLFALSDRTNSNNARPHEFQAVPSKPEQTPDDSIQASKQRLHNVQADSLHDGTHFRLPNDS